MPVFVYKGVNRAGLAVSGERSAASKQALTVLLRREQITASKISGKRREITLPGLSQPIKACDLVVFTRQFSVMVDAGLPMVLCLEMLASQQSNKAFQKVLTGVREAVEGGATLSAAMKKHGQVFDALYCNMVEAGESGGILDVIFRRVSSYIEKNAKLKRAVKSALIYPSSVMGIATAVVVLLLWKVVPIFVVLFKGLNATLPLPTQIVIALSNLVGSVYGLLALLTLITTAVALRLWYRTKSGRLALDAALLRLPLVGILLRKIAVGRFTRTLGTLVASGVPLLEALDITAKTSGNAVVERAIQATRKAVESGRSLVDPLQESGVFPGMVTRMIAVGEQTGALDTMLAKIADFYEDEVDVAVKDLLTALEPVMIVFLGVVVGGVVISMYLPLFSLIGQLSGGHG